MTRSHSRRVRPRSGLVQDQLFGGQICANWRPLWQARPKNPEKIIKEGAKSGGKWRFCEGQCAISPRLEPTALDRKPLSCESLRPRAPAASSRQRRDKAPFLDFGFRFSDFGCHWSVVSCPLLGSRRPVRGPVSIILCPLSVAGIAPALAGGCPWSVVRCCHRAGLGGPVSVVLCPGSVARLRGWPRPANYAPLLQRTKDNGQSRRLYPNGRPREWPRGGLVRPFGYNC